MDHQQSTKQKQTEMTKRKRKEIRFAALKLGFFLNVHTKTRGFLDNSLRHRPSSTVPADPGSLKLDKHNFFWKLNNGKYQMLFKKKNEQRGRMQWRRQDHVSGGT